MKPVKFDGRVPDAKVNVSTRRPLREGAQLLAGLLVFGALFLTIAATLVDRIVPYVPRAWEGRLFPNFEALGHQPEDDLELAELERLQDVMRRLSEHWPDHPEGMEVGLMNQEEPNALAFPGGLILVTRGLLEQVESENELAFVIGHELGHYCHRDHLRSLGRGLAFALLAAAVGRGGSVGDLVSFSGELSSRRFGRDQESAADAFALELVVAEYGHVGGATEFFERLPAPQSRLERSLATYLSTHPLSEERLQDLATLAEKRGWPARGQRTPLEFPR